MLEFDPAIEPRARRHVSMIRFTSDTFRCANATERVRARAWPNLRPVDESERSPNLAFFRFPSIGRVDDLDLSIS